jgi:hypothetical protein
MPLASTRSLNRPVLLLAALAAALGTPAAAATWTEVGDAPDVPAMAQITFGSGSLTTISGTLANDADVDMYCISIVNEPGFVAAYTPCASHAEPDMWLFATNGNGVTHADFCQGGMVTLTSAFVNSAGYYYLAISGTNADAMNGASSIWQSTNAIFSERSPDGPGAPGPISGWGGARVVSNVNYTINLQGVEFCDLPVPATPQTWGRVKARY